MLFRISLLLFCFSLDRVHADWPQINGPNRNGVASPEEKLNEKWPAKLIPVWKHNVGSGFAGPAVTDDQLIIFHRPDSDYLCESLDPRTGTVNWSRTLECMYAGGGPDGDTGPKCVPVIDGDLVFLFGTDGGLFCLSAKDGKTVWKTNVQQKYRSPPGYFGSGSTPLIAGDKLIVNVGGKSAGVVAFEKTSGKEIWKSVDDRASYSSPIIANAGAQQLLICVTRLNLVGLNPADGKVLFETPFGVRGPSANGAMPLALGEFLFVNAAYGVGAKYFRIQPDGLKMIWGNDSSYSSQYSTPVNLQGKLYGTAGREDFRNGSLRCVDAATGNVDWKKDFPVGHCILVRDQILFLDCQGRLRIVKANPKAYEELASFQLFGSARAMPALNNGILYARSNARRGNGTLIAVQVGSSN